LATTKALELAQLSALTTVDASGNVTTNTSQIANASGDLTFDSAADIILNVDGGDLRLYDNTVQFGRIANDSTDLVIEAYVADRSLVFKGLDGSTPITALTIDMSASGAATFLDQVTIGGNLIHAGNLTIDAGGDITLNADGADVILADGAVEFGRFKRDNGHLVIKSETIDKSVIIKGTTTSNAVVTALTFDMANSGRATFNENVVIQGDLTVEGTSVTLNTTDLNVEDKNITLNYHATADTSASAGGAGITIQDAVNSTTDASILWNATNSAFDFSHEITAPSALTLTSNAPRIFLYEADTTDLNTALFSSGGKFTIRTTTDDDATRTTRLEVSHSTGDIGFYENNGGTPQVGMHWDYADGYLGIGLTAPSSELHVRGVSRFETPSTSGGNKNYFANVGTGGHDYWIMSTSDANGSLGGGKFAIGTDSITGTNADQTRFTIDGSGNVGIGATSPGDFAVGPFVVGDGTTVQGMTIYTGNSHEGIIRFADGTSGSQQYEGQIKYDHADNKMRFYTDHVERFRVDNAGSLISKSTSIDYQVDRKLTDSIGAGNADRYILIAKTNIGAAVKFIGTITGTRQTNVSAHAYAEMQVGFSINSSGQYPKFYIDNISGYNASSYYDTTARWVSLDYDDGNGSANWWAIQISSSDSSSWAANLTNMHFKGYMSNVTPTVISSDTNYYNAVSNITELGRGGTRGIMHTDVGIGTTNPQGGLHLWSSDYDRFVIERDNGGSNIATASFNAYGSTTNTNPRLAIGVGPTVATLTNTMNIAPGAVGIGTFDPQVSLHIGDGTTDEFIILDKGTSNTSGILLKNGGNNKVKLLANSSEELELHTNNTMKVRINELGSVYNYTSEPTIDPVLSLDFTNTDKLDHRVSFSRKNAATYVDRNGYVKVVPHGVPRFTHDPTTLEPLGLLIEPYSKNQLPKWAHTDTEYAISNGYVRPRDQVLSPAGDMTAMKVVTRLSGSGQTVIKPSITLDGTAWHTFSIYMKKAEHRYFLFRSDNQANWCLFDLDTGTIDTSGNSDAYDVYGFMTAHNNGWWRIEYTHHVTGGTGNDVEIFFSDVNRNGTVTTAYGDGVYIWGMQMEAQTQEKMRATSLIPSTLSTTASNSTRSTFVNSDGNVTRSGIGSKDTRKTYGLWEQDFLPAGEIIENASTNRVRSHNPGIDQAGWVISNVDMDWAQTTTAPDGITTLPLFADTSANSRHSISHTTTSAQTSGGWNSWSFWIKPSSLDNIHLEMGYQGSQYSSVQITFDNAVTDPITGITTGLIGIGSTAKDGLIVGYPNGWYHVRFNTIATSSGSTYAYFAMKDDAGAIQYTGDGTSGFWLWGMQIEFGSYWPTTLIETSGTEVTRATDTWFSETAVRYEDVARIENYHFGDLYDNREGTLYADAAIGRGGRIGIYWDGDNDQIEIYNSGAADTIYGFIYNNLATQATLSTGTAPYNQVFHKHALAWRDNDSSIFYRNGAIVGSDNSVNVPNHLKYLNLGYYIDDKVHGITIFKKVQYYNRRLDGVNLQALTEND